MVRSRRSISKEDALSLLADSGVSLSSPPSATNDGGGGGGSGKSKHQQHQRAINATKLKADNTDLILVEDDEDDENDDVAFVDDGVDDDELQLDERKNNDDDDDDCIIDDDDDEADEDFVPTKTKIKQSTKRRRQTSLDKATAGSSTTSKRANNKKSTNSLSSLSASSASSASSSAIFPTTSNSSNSKKLYKSHNCSICPKVFRGKSDLQRHMLIHSNERPFKCDKCDKAYRQAVNLKNHYTAVHDNQKQYKCQQCPKAFALKERLRLHMRLHSGVKPYVCSLCKKCFARGGQLSQHILTNHPDDSTLKQFRCKICSSAFTTAANLRAHQERHEQGPNHNCEICFEHFANEDLLRAHMHKIHQKLESFKCKICKEIIDEGNSAEHMKTHSNASSKTHICKVCHAYFTQKSQYNVHMRMHTGERPYQCRICWQSFAHTSVLKLHIRKHTGEKPFQCLLCKDDETSFSQLAHLKNHMKKIHKQDNSYMCIGCGEFFKIKADLQSHVENSKSCDSKIEALNAQQQEEQTLSNLRFNIALLMKKISNETKLKQLGYEKRLIDNVLVASLKLANRRAYDDQKLSAIERMRLNVREFLNWIVPPPAMEEFHQSKLSDESILEKIATVYMKQK